MQTYRSALTPTKNARKGLATTHEGGVAYEVDPFVQFNRFLVLGSISGSYYASAQDLTKQNLDVVDVVLSLDPARVIKMIVDVSDNTLAASNEPALLALAKAAAFGLGGPDATSTARVRDMALNALPTVARTGTHLLHFVDYVSSLRGWGTVLRRAIGNWYIDKHPMSLAYQVTKYQSRDGWSHKDVLRLVHPKAVDPTIDGIFNYVVNDRDLTKVPISDVQEYLSAVNVTLSPDSDKAEVIRLIDMYNLPREVINSKWLNDPDILSALLPHMPIHALLRNLGNLGKAGVLTELSDAEKMVNNKLVLGPKTRLHPIDVLKAQMMYRQGRGLRGSGTWIPVATVVDRLEDLFYESFKTIEPTNKKLYLALDVSGSMSAEIGGFGLSCAMASTVLAMVTARTESQYVIKAFSDRMVPLNITANDSLETAMRKTNSVNFGWTYCNLPVDDAISRSLDVDAFVIYTDSETAGDNVANTFARYQRVMHKPDSKFIVNGMVANNFSLADPNNPNMLDVVGFSSDAPAVMSAFIRGEI